MTRTEALEVIRASLAAGSDTPTLGPDRSAYIAEQSRLHEAAVIEPVNIEPLGAAFPEHGLLGLIGSHGAVAVAHSEPNWLGFIPATGDFFLTYGPNPHELNVLGFRSSDALTEWLG